MDTAKRIVRDDIGSQWPDLAQELGFSQSDIDEIRRWNALVFVAKSLRCFISGNAARIQDDAQCMSYYQD